MESTLEEGLLDLGFTPQEILAYLALLQKSPMTGYAVANTTGIKKYKVYEILESLVKKGCVAVSRTTAAQYVAIAYEDFVRRHRVQQERNRELALEACTAFAQTSESQDMLWSFYRKTDIFEQLCALIDSCNRSLLLKIWAQDIPFVESALETAHRRGVQLFVVVLGAYQNDTFPFFCYQEAVFGAEVHQYRTIKGEFDQGAVCCCSLSDQGQSYATWTSNPVLLMPIHASLGIDISIARLYEQATPAQQALWGADFFNIREKYMQR